MQIHFRTLIIAIAGIGLLPLAGSPGAAAPPVLSARCPAVVSQGLATLSQAFLAANDRLMLATALRAERSTRACGDLRDAVSFETIAADAYDDVNDRHDRCAALRDAARRNDLLTDRMSVSRGSSLRNAARTCRA
ncbi:MAG: hypothetical protein M3169_13095 [Candidatus Eremiobacteraeota bacterium]|nr:hypothetical protein [Candidatus Eremiobacteraeota bacterium]